MTFEIYDHEKKKSNAGGGETGERIGIKICLKTRSRTELSWKFLGNLEPRKSGLLKGLV